MLKHKNGFICLIFELKCLSQVYISMQNDKTIFGIFRKDKSIFKNIFNMCFCPRTVTDRPGRPTARVDRTKGRSTVTVDRRAQPCARLADTGPADRAVDRTRELCSLYLGGRPGDRQVWPNGHIYDRWRSTGRSTASLSGWQISLTVSFLGSLYIPHFLGVLYKIFKSKNSYFSEVFLQVLKGV